ncbi:MAG: DUF4129 domain-containing protein [Chloroflexi bacterium OHK40]
MTRLLFFVVLAALEATAVSLPLTALIPAAPPWLLLFGVVALGWLADQVALRLPARFERPVLLGGALAAATTLIGATLGLGPGRALVALLPGSGHTFQAYLTLLLALYLFWRGTRLTTHESDAVQALFGRATAAAVIALMIGALAGTATSAVLGHAVALVALGLLGLALAHAQETAGGRLNSLNWRWLLTLLAAIGLVVALAILVTSLLGGGEAMAAAQTLLRVALLPFALVGGLIAYLLITFVAEPLTLALRAILAALRGVQPPPTDPVTQEQGAAGLDAATDVIVRLANSATFLLALIPITILVLAILLLRRRARPRPRPDEERESLGLLSSLTGDLRDLLASLRNPFARPPEGLRAALAALRGDDPATRARRAYVRLLLLLEKRDRHRPAAATPGEFRAAAAEATGHPEAVAHLTTAYERARYNPTGATPADADAAEAALRSIDEAPSR